MTRVATRAPSTLSHWNKWWLCIYSVISVRGVLGFP